MLRRARRVLAGVAMAAMVLAVLPTQAKAQEGAASAPNARHATRAAEYANVVVRPGDSLWKMSEERLGPDAAPQRIANDVRRIAALNHDRIGADPNLLVAGQVLLLPPVGRPSAAKLPAPNPGPAKQAKLRPVGRGPGGETARVPGGAADEVGGAAVQAPNPAPKKGMLPDAPTAPWTPEVGAPPSAGTAFLPRVTFFEGPGHPPLLSAIPSAARKIPRDDPVLRRLLGSGIIALTLLVAGLMAYSVPLKRSVGEEAEMWKVRSRYFAPMGGLAQPMPVVGSNAGSLGGRGAEAMNGSRNAGMLVAARKRRRERILRKRARGLRTSPRGYLVSGAPGPQIIRQLRAEAFRGRGPMWISAPPGKQGEGR